MNWLPRDIEYVISLLTTIIPHIRNILFVIDAKISNKVNVLPLDNTLDALEKTPCTPLCLAFVLSYQLGWVIKVFYKSICAFSSQKPLEKCQITDFRDVLIV